MHIQDTPVGIVAFARESVTVADSSIGLTAGTYLDAVRAILTLEDDEIRITTDGTAASAVIGHIINIDDVITIVGSHQLANFRGCRTGAVSGVLQVTYFH
jgi:hypothetical protein